MLKARDIMTTEVVTVDEDMSLDRFGQILIERGISGAPVTDAHGSITGILTENDLIRKNMRLHIPTVIRIFDAIIPLGSGDRVEEEIRRMTAATVGEICTRKVITVSPESTLQDISTIMAEKDVHLLPVVESGKIVGIIGKADIIKGMTVETSKQKSG